MVPYYVKLHLKIVVGCVFIVKADIHPPPPWWRLGWLLTALIWPRITLRSYGAALTSEKCSVRVIHSFLAHILLGVDLIPGLERVILVGFNLDVMVNPMHLLFSVQVDTYLTSQRLFVCLVKLSAKGLPPVVEIPHEAFEGRRSVRAVP